MGRIRIHVPVKTSVTTAWAGGDEEKEGPGGSFWRRAARGFWRETKVFLAQKNVWETAI
jgi:hypothetical protein